MSNGHTLAPWKWSAGRLLHNEPGRYSITILDIEEPKWRPTDEDARLIAAAPDLLDALEAMLEECDPDEVELRRALVPCACSHRKSSRHPMLTEPQALLLICVLAALWGWEWWRRNWKGGE